MIAILGILASVVLSSLNSARAKGRDAKRDSDIHQIHNALALYYDDYQSYPESTGPTRSNDVTDWATLSTNLAPYIGTLPVDPLNDSSYYYTYETTDVLSTDYTLTTIYERDVENTITILNPVSGLISTYGTTPRAVFITQPTAGNMLVLAVRNSMNLTDNIVTDNQGNTYTLIHSYNDVQFFRSNNLTGVMPTSLSISWGDGTSRTVRVQMQEMSGVSSTNPVDYVGNVTSGSTSNSITFNATNANEAVFGYLQFTGGGRDYTINEEGYSRTPSGVVENSVLYKSNLGTSGSKTISLSWSVSTSNVMGIATFNPQ